MFYSNDIAKKYKQTFKKEVDNSTFDEEAFFNIVQSGLEQIKDDLISKDYSIDLNNLLPYCYFDSSTLSKIKKIIKKYREERNLIAGDNAIEDALEDIYKYNMDLIKVKSIEPVSHLKNFIFYIVVALFLFEKNKNIDKLFEKHKITKLIKDIDNLLLEYQYTKNEILFVIITLLTWAMNSMEDLFNQKILTLKSSALLHQEMKQQQINDGDNKIEQQAEIIPLKLTSEKLKKLSNHFKKKIIGQDQVIDKLNEILISQMYNVSKKNHRPIGVLFFVGPTGVGKTETVKELAKFLYDSEQIHRFDMSEYKSEVAIQKLIGAPNGYVGYQEGGTLTNAMIKNPNTIVLFDEIEKADKSVFDLFLQMIDEGMVTSNKGVKCYFDNTIIVFTSNLGVSNITAKMGFENIEEIIKENVEYFFNRTINRPELLGRIGSDNIVVFDLIHKKEDLFKILDIQFESFLDEYATYNIEFKFDKEKVYDEILANIDLSKGARDIRNKFEVFKKHLFHAFFKEDLSIDDMKNKTIEFEYKDKVVKIKSVTDNKKKK